MSDPFAQTELATPTDPHADTQGSAPVSVRPTAHPLIGKTLAHFRVEAPLGQGGMGTVFRAWDTALERPVALKVLGGSADQARKRFLREARAQAKVRHPNVVPIHYVGEQDGVVFLSMDLIEGPTVAERLEDGPLPVDEALDIADAVANALSVGAARGLIHRDVKPSNVLMAEDGHVLLADFGIAKAVGAPRDSTPEASAPGADALTHHGAIVGTPAYMAPEQTVPGEIDHRADMYALGVTLFEMLTGRPLYEAENTASLLEMHREATPPSPRSLREDLPPAVEALVGRLLERDPKDRFDDYATLREAIAGARTRRGAAGGVFTRGVAFGVDLIPSALIGIALSEIHDVITWPGVALIWALTEWRWGKTLGKRLFALRVVDAHDERIGFGRALGRNLVKFWGPTAYSLYAIDLGLVDPRWDNAVEAAITIVWLLGMAIAFAPKKRAAHDRVSKTRVVYDLGSR